MIMSNNWVKFVAPQNFKYIGAIVGNPLLSPKSHERYGLYSDVVDLDAGSFYPSSIIVCNTFMNTLLFKVRVPNDQFSRGMIDNSFNNIINLNELELGNTDEDKIDTEDYQENKDDKNYYLNECGGYIMDNYSTRNWLTIGYNHLNYPSIEQVLTELGEV